MSQQIEKLAVLFADICGSTALYDHLGDDLARRLIAQCIGNLCAEVSKQQGLLIKTIGDEAMCTFHNAEQAFHAACAMQRAVKNGTYEGGHKMSVRIGFHYGDVIREAGDVFGDTVNVASRVASITRTGQIMTTLVVVEHLPPALRVDLRQVMRAEFKGKQERFDIFQVLWEQDDGMSTRIGIPAYRKSPPGDDELVLKYLDQTIAVNKDRRTVVLGRDKSCELVVSGELTSRQHARIELRGDKFMIVDQSTNGTYIRTDDGRVCYLVREEMILPGSGTISLGRHYSGSSADLVEYTITPNHA